MSAGSNETLIRSMYEAFSSGDVEAMSRLLAPDAIWSVGGNNPLAGDHKGQDDIFALFAKCGELSGGDMHLEVLDVKAEGNDRVVSTHRLKAGLPDGRKLDITETEEFTIEDGKITRVDESVSDAAANDAFWS